jgi:hypothetical protein
MDIRQSTAEWKAFLAKYNRNQFPTYRAMVEKAGYDFAKLKVNSAQGDKREKLSKEKLTNTNILNQRKRLTLNIEDN